MFQTVVVLKSSEGLWGNDPGDSSASEKLAATSRDNPAISAGRNFFMNPILRGVILLVFRQCQQFRLLQQKSPALEQMRLERLDVVFQHLNCVCLIAAVHSGP